MTDESWARVMRLRDVTPERCPPARIYETEDGSVTLIWLRSHCRLVTVRVPDSGDPAMMYVDGTNSGHARGPDLADMLRQWLTRLGGEG
jgi:hypothetical protein